MRRNHRRYYLMLLAAIVMTGVVVAQRGRRRNWDDATYDRNGVEEWAIDHEFKDDVFTFVRVKYDSHGGRRGWGGGGWRTDFPDSDLNFSLRLQQLTSLKVNPNPVVLELTDKRLFDYPFLYLIEPGRLMFYQNEADALRRYLENGGFMMVDDFWGDDEYENFRYELQKVFPDRKPEELPLSHEIFRCVYELKEKPQVPSINAAWDGRSSGRTWEPRYSDTSKPHYRAVRDDDGRIMVLICHNTDLGDGWEREGENQWYFDEFSVKKAYPMGINIVTYAMTH